MHLAYFGRVIGGLLLSLCVSAVALATPVTWTLTGVTFADGGTATGWFVYDADTGAISDWSVSVAGGDTATFPALTYMPATGGALNSVSTAGLINFTLTGTNRQIRLAFASPLTNAGGTVAFDLDNPSASECYNCGVYRLFTAGSFVGTVAPTITSASTATFPLNEASSFTVTTTGLPTPTLSISGTLPEGLSFTDNGDGTATITGTPGPAGSGRYALTITASNGTAPDATLDFTLLVPLPPSVPVPGMGAAGGAALLLSLLALAFAESRRRRRC